LGLRLFDERYFSIVGQTHSWQANQDRYVESSMNPDYVLRYLPTKEEFNVECKYRSNLDKGMLNWLNSNILKEPPGNGWGWG